MSTFEEERERDFAAYEAMKGDLLREHLGKYAAIADGRLMLVSEEFDDAFDAVRDFRHALVFQVGSQPKSEIVYIRGGPPRR